MMPLGDKLPVLTKLSDTTWCQNDTVTKDSPYFGLMGELWGVCCEHFNSLSPSDVYMH